MDTKELEKIELRKDGNAGKRFGDFAKQIVTVSKEDIEAKEKSDKEKKLKSA